MPRLLLECLQAFLLTRESAGPRDPALLCGQGLPRGPGSAQPGQPGAHGLSGPWGCLPARLAPVPASQFSKGQANCQGQGLPGLAKWGRFSGLGDFEPAAVAGVAGPAEQRHRPPGELPASCWRVRGSRAGPSPGQQSQQRADGAGGGRRPLQPRGFTAAPPEQRPQPGFSGPSGQPGQSAGLKPPVLNPGWEILTVREEAPQAETRAPALCLSLGRRAVRRWGCVGSICELLTPPSGHCQLCSQGFRG